MPHHVNVAELQRRFWENDLDGNQEALQAIDTGDEYILHETAGLLISHIGKRHLK